MGMSHRGRLNVLANIVGKSYAQIFREFEGELDPNVPQGSGDVKYHVGATGKFTAPSRHARSRITLAANPSHLEAVDPVVEGMARAKQDRCGDVDHDQVLSVLIHGDAAFAGQGVVAETLNLSELPGYDVGGTVHIVVNNQVGFTTTPGFARSTVYATDIAKAVQAPIFHVNGDDPEACVRVVRLAFAFRQAFKKDVVVDMVCYRRYGHNEGDEPAFTQPRMYEVIGQRRSVRKLYTELLVNRGDLTLEDAEQGARRLPRPARRRVRGDARLARAAAARVRPHRVGARDRGAAARDRRAARAARADRRRARRRSRTASRCTRSSQRIIGNRRKEFDDDQRRLGARRSARVRLAAARRHAGARSRARTRGAARSASGTRCSSTTTTEAEYTPLAHLGDDAAPFMVYDSVLSEFAALGFEYGYSVADRDALVCWEAQFGDFGNGAQTIIDQFIVAAEDKWGQRSGLVLLLPHGFEGQGPEHSSARLERFLVLCAEDNIRVVYPTTAAQYFHVLRRQVHDPSRKPLIVMTPKRYLRMPATVLAGRRSSSRGAFQLVLARPGGARSRARSRASCSAAASSGTSCSPAATRSARPVAIVRLEQLYPWPEREIADRARSATRRRGRLGAGRAGQHGRPLLRPPPHRGDVRRPRGRRGRPPREPEPRVRQLHRARRPAARPPRRGHPHARTERSEPA